MIKEQFSHVFIFSFSYVLYIKKNGDFTPLTQKKEMPLKASKSLFFERRFCYLPQREWTIGHIIYWLQESSTLEIKTKHKLKELLFLSYKPFIYLFLIDSTV